MELREAEKMREMQWGGDLKIGIRSARGLLGLPKGTMLFAKVRVLKSPVGPHSILQSMYLKTQCFASEVTVVKDIA
jgi:hypothetical protein